ncbi:RNA polymerase sigma factor [Cellulomonas alba]|uniref:Sigma-70 family RNA polymerase sigma factor n=1 Tax=Cellulomonas alba TaxID=3053467 RepID=A0ABT7SE62_9CELL|nr:sigma-70 family RNA polymerase sigma factor [Cellulomonas alba]MDM7854457.1 sigma-70 family RNA polymerase sigma factor [Cellulomonas alba]
MGWEQALDALVRDRGAALVGHAYLLTGDVREAEDLVQDALVRVFSRGRPVTEIRSAEAYVRRAIHTIYLDGFRRRRHWATIRHLAAVDERAHVLPPELAVGDRLVLAEALATLSPRQRACVVLHHVEDLPVDEIALLLDLSAGAVKRYLSDGRAALRAALVGTDVGPPQQRTRSALADRDAPGRRRIDPDDEADAVHEETIELIPRRTR